MISPSHYLFNSTVISLSHYLIPLANLILWSLDKLQLEPICHCFPHCYVYLSSLTRIILSFPPRCSVSISNLLYSPRTRPLFCFALPDPFPLLSCYFYGNSIQFFFEEPFFPHLIRSWRDQKNVLSLEFKSWAKSVKVWKWLEFMIPMVKA